MICIFNNMEIALKFQPNIHRVLFSRTEIATVASLLRNDQAGVPWYADVPETECCVKLKFSRCCLQSTGICCVRKPHPTSVGLRFLPCIYPLSAAHQSELFKFDKALGIHDD